MPITLKKFPISRKMENFVILFNVSLFSEIQFFLMYRMVTTGTMMLMTKQHTPYTIMKEMAYSVRFRRTFAEVITFVEASAHEF